MASTSKVQKWAETELSEINFGDKRLNKRAKLVLSSLGENPQASIPEASNEWSEVVGAYRLIDHKKVNQESISTAHRSATINRMREHKIVLAAHDTTTLNYTGMKNTTIGLGEIGKNQKKKSLGFIMHDTYAISTDGVPLGVIDCNIWSRKTSKYKSSQKRAKTPISKKESSKWLNALQRVTEATKDLKNTKIVHLMDREGDIYELFSEARKLEQDFIIRVKHNRRVNKSSRTLSDGQLLSKALASTKPLGTVDLAVNSRTEVGGKRTAEVEIKAANVRIPAPKGKSDKIFKFTHKELNLTVIWIREVNHDEDIEPIEWKLITNIPISNPDDVLLCLQYYCKRWHIEVYFRILKTGCRVEECRFSSAAKIKVFIAFLQIVAWHIHRMTLLSRVLPKGDPDLVFTKQEQEILSKVILKRKPQKRFRLRDYVILLARLGGFLNRKSDGEPGSEVLWRGWVKLKTLLQTLLILKEVDES